MAATVTRPARGQAPQRGGPAVDRWASKRAPYLDNLKVILIASIIAIHGILGYAGLVEVWSYTDVREVTLAPVTEAVLFVVVAPFGFFLMPLLFLVAGLLTRPSLERKGTAAYVRDRLLRLGVPFIAYVLLVQPALMYGLEHPLGEASGSYWYEFLGEERQVDTGPLWFVGVLLVFSLGYAGWAGLRRHHPARPTPGPVTVRRLLLLSAAVAPASFLVRLAYPYGSESGFTDLNLWEWPACAAVFALGIVASRQGWFTAVPERLGRQCRTVTLLAFGAMAAFLTITGLLDMVDEWMGGWNWPALGFAVIEGPLTVFGSVWLLQVAQRRLNRRARWGPVLGRSAYGAFMVQTLLLLGVALVMRPVPVPAEVKALVVAAGGVAGSFALAWLLISRLPGAARIL
ncbi:MAG TPA: acyltransferase [Micromonosporaceae bacterium]|nr:acyltransferase [Micromonosporaceae bacterium]